MTDERPGTIAAAPSSDDAGAGTVGVVVTEEHEPRSLRMKIALLAAAVVVVGLWTWALVFSVVRKDPERLTSAEHTAVVQACKTAAATERALPAVPNPPTNASVAARANGETAALGKMVAELRAIHPQRAPAAEALSKWLDDWDALLGARRAYGAAVVTDRGAELVIPAVKGTAITVRMNNYAESKSVEDCDTTALGAENVNGLHP
jgi:hypothetical protein